jgi:hypothetical protein
VKKNEETIKEVKLSILTCIALWFVDKCLAFASIECPFVTLALGVAFTRYMVKKEIIRISNEIKENELIEYRATSANGVLIIDGWESTRLEHLVAFLLKIRNKIILLSIVTATVS